MICPTPDSIMQFDRAICNVPGMAGVMARDLQNV
jgi:hypothetical protein